jgi:hypothetical protein
MASRAPIVSRKPVTPLAVAVLTFFAVLMAVGVTAPAILVLNNDRANEGDLVFKGSIEHFGASALIAAAVSAVLAFVIVRRRRSRLTAS